MLNRHASMTTDLTLPMIDGRVARVQKSDRSGSFGKWFIYSASGPELLNLTVGGKWSRERFADYFYAASEAEAIAFISQHASPPHEH